MTTRKFFLRRLHQPAPSERIETGPDLPPEDASLARDLLALAQSVQPDREFVTRLEGELSRTRPAAHPAAQATPSVIERIRHAVRTTWGWALPVGAVILLILVISLLVQMRPRHTIPSGQIPATHTPVPSGQIQGSAPTSPAASPTETIYIVQEGDTLDGIASYFGVTPDAIFAANHMQSGDVLRVGMSLIIPLPAGVTVTPGTPTPPVVTLVHISTVTPTPVISLTPVPAGVFALLFYPPVVMNYDSSIWSDASQYTNTAKMVNTLQARDLDTCIIGPVGPSGNFPSPDETVSLGSIRYQVTTVRDSPPGSTTAYYIDTGSLATYYYEKGAIVLTVRASQAQWDECKALAEPVLSSLHSETQPSFTPTPQPTAPPLLAELQGLAARRTADLLASPGWLYVDLKRTNSTNCGSLLPNGAFNPCEIEEHDWYELNAQGQVVRVITRQLDPSGKVFQETVTRSGLSRNLTFGFESTTTLTTTYAVDWGFAAEAAQALADGASLSQDDRFHQAGDGQLALLLVEGDMLREAVFDPQTAGLLSLSTWKQEPDGFTQTDSVNILEEQRVDQPPSDALALLDQPLTPYQPLPPQGDPVPAGFDLAYSLLGMRNIAGDSFNAPTFWYGDIYADGSYLVGRVDFGATPGGFCQRSPDGLKLAFDHVTLSNANPAVHRLSWLELSSPADVHQVLPELQLVSLPVWGPDSVRLAFTACDASQSCGLYTYDTQSGALLRLAYSSNAVPPVWSQDGAEIAFRSGPSDVLQTVVVDAASGMVITSPSWQPQFVNLKDASVLNQCMLPPALAPTRPAAPADWKTYANAQYGFSFRYPADWTLEESSNSVLLTKGTLQISIGFRDMKEQASITRTGVGSGDISPDGHISFFGLALTRHVLVYGGKLKAVLYNSAAETPRGDLVFTLSLDDFNLDYDAVDLSAAVQQMADQVVESFAWIPTPPAQPTATATP